MGIPDQVLNKATDLTKEERKMVGRHPIDAYELLKSVDTLHSTLDIPLYHHERWDGEGYPHGLSGEKIPLPARIFAVVDVWDALLSDRPYRKAWSKEEALEHIKSQSGRHFDPKVVKAFLEIIEVDDNLNKQQKLNSTDEEVQAALVDASVSD
jgi:HD-GYP domain-containing protein (c-di-GMP phosphodiesterase class II)